MGGAMNDVLLTGLPRSGTTLSCELLNLVPGTVALDEPMSWTDYAGNTSPGKLATSAACKNVDRFIAATRQSIRSEGTAISKHVAGKVTGKKISDQAEGSQDRVLLVEHGVIDVGKPQAGDFTLVVKQVAGFTALLEPLSERYPVYALVRNPLAVLCSWQTVPLPVREGHLVFGEALDPSLAQRLALMPDRMDRQLFLLGWFFSRFRDLLDREAVIRYEDLVAQNGRALRGITVGAGSLDVPLQSRNHNPSVYDPAVTAVLGSRLLDTDGSWWHFYSPQSVRELLHELD